MPTSPRDLAGGTCWYQPTALLSNPRADEGHRPLRVWEVFATQLGPSYVFRGPLHPRRKRPPLIRHALRRATFPGGEGCLRRGITVYLLCCLSGISPGDSSTGCYTVVESSLEKGLSTKKFHSSFTSCGEIFLIFQEAQAAGQGREGVNLRHIISFRLIF